MMVSSLFEPNILKEYIKLPQYLTLIFSFISVFLLIIGAFVFYALYFFVLCIFVTTMILFIYLKNRKVYGKKLLVKETEYSLYSITNKHIFSFLKSEVNFLKMKVLFNGPGMYSFTKECLIICKSQRMYEELVSYDILENISYWNNREAIIVQNPELIMFLEKTQN